MQAYKSSKNEEISRKMMRRQGKQRGEIPFEVLANTSGRIITKFGNEYTELPFILLTPVVGEGHEFDIVVVLTERTKKDFTVNIQNTGSEPVKGTIMWFSE